jgi:hypothetical protein
MQQNRICYRLQVQQEVVAAQARQHTLFRPDCQSCSGRCHVKGWRPHRIATLFGEVRVKLPRLACAGGGCGETGGGWPSRNRWRLAIALPVNP